MEDKTDQSENFDGVRISRASLESFSDSLNYNDKYTNFYNVLASEGKAVEAVSHLSSVREELIRLSEQVKRKVNHQVDIYREFFQLEESDSEEIQKVYSEIQEQIERAFPYSFRGNSLGITEERLSELTLKYCELKGISKWLEIEMYNDRSESYKNPLEELTYEDRIDVFTYTIYRDKEKLEDYLLHWDVVESVIETVIFSGYPDELNKELVRDFNECKTGKRGRPFDESADQKKIEKKVKELVKKGKEKKKGYKIFWHHEGRFKDTPNKNQIKKKIIKENLTGELGDSAIDDRIRRAINSIPDK